MIRSFLARLILHAVAPSIAADVRYTGTLLAELAAVTAAAEAERDAAREREGAAVRALHEERARCEDYAADARRYHREREEAREALRVEQLEAGQAKRELASVRAETERLSAELRRLDPDGRMRAALRGGER